MPQSQLRDPRKRTEAGHSYPRIYQQIADEIGYQNKGTVYAIIKQAQSAQLSEAVEEHRELELARLDALQEGLWPEAVAGTPQQHTPS